MRSIIWRQTSGKTHRVVIDEGLLVSPLHDVTNIYPYTAQAAMQNMLVGLPPGYHNTAMNIQQIANQLGMAEP